MKQKFILLMVAMCATMFTACSKNDDKNPLNENSEGIIIMETEVLDMSEIRISTLKEGEIITIDWGDGNVEEFKSIKNYDNEYEDDYYVEKEHTYSNTKSHTISIKGKINRLDCADNGLTKLDVSKCTALTVLYCDFNELTTLNVSGCSALIKLDCEHNQLTSINLSECNALTFLRCSKNELTTLDISKCTALKDLECYRNQLTILDVSKNTALRTVYCSSNQLTESILNRIFTDLPKGKTWVDEDGETQQSYISMHSNLGSETCNKSIAENKGWKIY